MSRIFPDFLSAYEEYANDKFVPPQFNTWSALSIIAGALERRVWLPWNTTYSFYPNIYVLLVSKPGQGKSVSLKKAVDLLQHVHRKTSTINIMPSQVTEAKFIELMGTGRSFMDTSSGKEILVFQNAGYYYASEASNSLRNIFGDFIACLTDFYDCPSEWERATKKDGKKIVLKNVCMNLLAGSTFDYLGKLVSDENIQGGFASRLIYVVQNEAEIKTQKWQNGQDAAANKLINEYEAALLQDLIKISTLTGPMTAVPAFGKAWESWYPAHQKKIYAHKSEKLQSILARTNTNVLKISMLLSAAESDDRVMKLKHFEKAVELVEGINAEVPGIFRESKASQGPNKGGNVLANMILNIVKKQPGITSAMVKSCCVVSGHNGMAIDNTIKALIDDKTLGQSSAVAGQGISLVIKGNADDHL